MSGQVKSKLLGSCFSSGLTTLIMAVIIDAVDLQWSSRAVMLMLIILVILTMCTSSYKTSNSFLGYKGCPLVGILIVAGHTFGYLGMLINLVSTHRAYLH